ncbi:hypothetical protein D9M71_554750 [compost metagenome]
MRQGRLKRHANNRRLLIEIAASPIVVVIQCQSKVAVHAKTDGRALVDLMADEQTGTWQVLQSVAPFVAVELIVAVPGEGHVAKNHLCVGADLSSSQLGDARRVAHENTGVAGQCGGSRIGQTVTFLTGFIDQNSACPSVASQ